MAAGTTGIRTVARTLGSQYAPSVRAFALVELGDSESVDLFLREEDARRALEDILNDEPDWTGLFYVKPVELDERAISVLAPTIARANKRARKAGKPEIQPGVTNHTMRRTFASLLYESGASPAYVMAQMGHESAALALEVYSKVMERKRDTGERMDALVRGADWARMGTNGANDDGALAVAATDDGN